MTVEIVILAMIAAFLGLRLYAVLGRRADHEETIQREPVNRFDAGQNGTGQGAVPAVRLPERPVTVPARVREVPAFPPAVERGLRDIAAADRRFDHVAFLEGARSAYRMILEAFWRGDKEELGRLCDPHVARGFAEEIDARIAAGERVDSRLVRIEEVVITDASYSAPMARVAVRFTSDIAAVTYDSAGHVVAGSLNDAVVVNDVWTFARNVGATSPDWMLEETDEG